MTSGNLVIFKILRLFEYDDRKRSIINLRATVESQSYIISAGAQTSECRTHLPSEDRPRLCQTMISFMNSAILLDNVSNDIKLQ